MKKLLDKVGKKTNAPPNAPLIGSTVVVGQYSVKVESFIGEGGYALIYKGIDQKSNRIFAVKHIKLTADRSAIKEVQHEAKMMAKLRSSPNILRLHAVAFAGPEGMETDAFMLLDYCPRNLLSLLQINNQSMDEPMILGIFTSVCQAVSNMHIQKPPIAHRDIKAENILQNSEGVWVVCDFGSATTRAKVYDTTEEMSKEEEIIRRMTTPAYRAPEMWDLYARHLIDTKVDIWALGVLLYVLCFGKLPFVGDSKLPILYGKYDMPSGRSQELRQLIKDLLTVDPVMRPDIHYALNSLNKIQKARTGDQRPLSDDNAQIAATNGSFQNAAASMPAQPTSMPQQPFSVPSTSFTMLESTIDVSGVSGGTSHAMSANDSGPVTSVESRVESGNLPEVSNVPNNETQGSFATFEDDAFPNSSAWEPNFPDSSPLDVIDPAKQDVNSAALNGTSNTPIGAESEDMRSQLEFLQLSNDVLQARVKHLENVVSEQQILIEKLDQTMQIFIKGS